MNLFHPFCLLTVVGEAGDLDGERQRGVDPQRPGHRQFVGENGTGETLHHPRSQVGHSRPTRRVHRQGPFLTVLTILFTYFLT